MSVLIHIMQGWKNYTFPNKQVEESAKKKAKICAKCPYAVNSVWDEILPDATLQEVKGMKCELCDCPLSTLLRSDKKCVDGRF